MKKDYLFLEEQLIKAESNTELRRIFSKIEDKYFKLLNDMNTMIIDEDEFDKWEELYEKSCSVICNIK
jgi:hypothetical protein